MEKKQIYREKSLARISSPEQMNSYLRVVNAGIWVALGAIIALLAGAVLWCSVITFESETVPAAVTVKNGELCLYFTAESRNKVSTGTTLHIGESDFVLPEADIEGRKLYTLTDATVMELLGLTENAYVYCIEFPADLPNGVYAASVVTEEISPFELLLN